MAEYIERDALLAQFHNTFPHKTYCTVGSAIHRIKEAPAADVVPVVRCKDCKHFYETGGVLEPWCDWHEARLFDGDGFCADGKRKDGDSQ